MARLLVILLVALLPLRGWSATGMAVQMALAGSAVEASVDAAHIDMPGDCPMMQMMADGENAPEKAMDGKAHQGCQTCQLCASMAALDAIPDTLVELVRPRLVFPLADRFSSAELFEDSKPPIY